MSTVCKREGCENLVQQTGKRGHPREYCSDECRVIAKSDSRQLVRQAEQRIVRRQEIAEAAESMRITKTCINEWCDRPVVVLGDMTCAICSARAAAEEKRAASRKRRARKDDISSV